MGNTITCWEDHCGESSSLNGNLYRSSGKTKVSSKSKKLTKKKSVKFMDSKKSKNAQESSKKKRGETSSSNLDLENSGIASDSARNGSAIKQTSDKYLSYVDDIKSLFVFDKQIGDGKFGTVYLAHPRNDGDAKVAIKIVPQDSFSHRIEKELELLSSINHPTIIRYISAYKDRAYFYIVTEYCDGGELFKKIVDQGGMDELEACGIMNQLLSSVKFLHDKNIWHRDLKPENILFKTSSSSQIKLLDFGLSKKLKRGEVMKKKLGTPYYIAPEILEEWYGKEIDLWSLGVVAFVLLWGYPPFYGQDAKELFVNIYNVNYEFWEEDWDFISDEAKDFISCLLVKDPQRRMTIEEAMVHPWIQSCVNQTAFNEKIDDLRSNCSNIATQNKKPLDSTTADTMSRSAECTTHDSYEKWLFNPNKSISV